MATRACAGRALQFVPAFLWYTLSAGGGAAHDALHVADRAAARLEVGAVERGEQLELRRGAMIVVRE